MIRIISTVLLLTCSITLSIGQGRFEAGYYVKPSGERVTGEIKNINGRYNPSSIEFRRTQDSETSVLGLDDVKEFGITGKVKYVRAKTKMDVAAPSAALSTSRRPDLVQKTVFLKVLVEGRLGLLSWQNEGQQLFFFQDGENTPEQLIYKKYVVIDEDNQRQEKENKDYIVQLTTHFDCVGLSAGYWAVVDYTQRSLVVAFTTFNDCDSGKYVPLDEDEAWFHLTLRPGINWSQLGIDHVLKHRTHRFDPQWSLRTGIEFEALLPSDNSEWALTGEVGYMQYTGQDTVVNFIVGTTQFQLKAIDLAVGGRYYPLIDNDFRLALGLQLSLGVAFDSYLNYDLLPDLDGVDGGIALRAEVGVLFWDRLQVAIQANTDRNVFVNVGGYSSKFSSFSALIGYRVF